jgi:hypothetical protein
MATIYVKKDGSGNALTIQQGIQLAALGDIVEVEAGTFNENIDLWKGITLKGAGIGSTIITGVFRTAITARTFTWTLGSNVLNVAAGADISAYEVGRIVTATGIPTNSRIVSKTSTSLTISANTTQAATTARSVAMSLQNDASMRVRGTNGVIRDLKVVGFDHPNPATEYSAIYFRNTALGSAAANGWEVFNCEFEANGEYAFLTDYAAGVGNLNVHDCKFTGKTFVGANPASGNQFSVWNVPRQLVAIQSVNTGEVKFQNNEVMGVTGGLTVDGIASFNTAVTIDPANALVSGNTINGTHGYGYALRVRGVGAIVENNRNYSFPNNENSGFLIGTVSGMTVGSNSFISALLATITQVVGETKVQFQMEKNALKSISKVASHPFFSNEANWKLVNFIFKHGTSGKRLTPGFRNDFTQTKYVKLKAGMKKDDPMQLHKIIISDMNRNNLVIKRSEIDGSSAFDFLLGFDGPIPSDDDNDQPFTGTPIQWQSFNDVYVPETDGGISSGVNRGTAIYYNSLGINQALVGDFELVFKLNSFNWDSAVGFYDGINNNTYSGYVIVSTGQGGLHVEGQLVYTTVESIVNSEIKISRVGTTTSFYVDGVLNYSTTTMLSDSYFPAVSLSGNSSLIYSTVKFN